MDITVFLKRLPHAADLPLPAYQSAGASGLDLMAALAEGEPLALQPMQSALVPTGYAFELPQGYEAQVRPRSGLAAKHQVTVLNAPGTIDADYRGEIKVILINLGKKPFIIERAQRIAQLVIAPIVQATLKEVDTLDDTARGSGGFGSTGGFCKDK